VSARVAIVGIRRNRQGLGPFVTRFLRELGAEVVAHVGRNPAPVDGVPGYHDLASMVSRHAPDGVVIASPTPTHLEYLEGALDASLPVLCEKPLVWGCAEPAAVASRLATEFQERGLLLMENVQWPCTLPAFRELHPLARTERPRTFEMLLSPSVRGVDALVESLPHPLSMLDPLLSRAVDIAFSRDDKGLSIRFRIRPTVVTIRLLWTDALPRRAAYAFDGCRADRSVDPDAYAISFRDGERSVAVPDPLRALLALFLQRLERPPESDPGISARIAVMEQVIQVYRRIAVERGWAVG